jgi:hypothetical protein
VPQIRLEDAVFDLALELNSCIKAANGAIVTDKQNTVIELPPGAKPFCR